MGLVGSPFSPWPSCRCWWCRWWCSWHRGSLLLFGTRRFSSMLLAPEMEPQGTLRTSVLPGTHRSPPHSCRTLCLVARGLPRTATHKDCLPIFPPRRCSTLGHFREPGRPEGHGAWTCTRSSLHLPAEGLRTSLAEVAGPGTVLRPAHAPHSLRRLPSRASPRELSRSGTNPFPGNTETPGSLPAPPFPPGGRIVLTAREELAPRRHSWCVAQGVPHAGCAWASARVCIRAGLPPQPQRWPRLLVPPLGRSGPPAGTRTVADVRRPRRRGVRAGTVEPVVLLGGRRAVSPSSVSGPVNHDRAGRQGSLDLAQLQGRLRSVVFLQASPLL